MLKKQQTILTILWATIGFSMLVYMAFPLFSARSAQAPNPNVLHIALILGLLGIAISEWLPNQFLKKARLKQLTSKPLPHLFRIDENSKNLSEQEQFYAKAWSLYFPSHMIRLIVADLISALGLLTYLTGHPFHVTAGFHALAVIMMIRSFPNTKRFQPKMEQLYSIYKY